MKDKKVDIYLSVPFELPPDGIYPKGRRAERLTGYIRGLYSDMLIVEEAAFYFYNQGQGYVLVDRDDYESESDTVIVPKSNVRAIVVREK